MTGFDKLISSDRHQKMLESASVKNASKIAHEVKNSE